MRQNRCVWLLIVIMILLPTLASGTEIALLPEPTINNNVADNGYYTATYADNPTSGETISFTKDDITIGLQPHSLNWNNALSQLQQINMPQNVQRTQNQEQILYQNAYGNGITLSYKNEWYGVKEEIIVDNLASLGTIEQYVIDGGEPYLEANFLLTTNAQHIIVEGAEWDKTSQTTTQNDIIIKNDQGEDIYYLPRPIATDAQGNEINGSYKLKKSSNKLYIGITIPYTFLETATYPVSIDPSFYVDYSPAPGQYYANGNQEGTTYDTFSSITDETITVSDGNTNTYITISNTPTTSQDDVFRAKFSHIYQPGYTYFLRIYKNSAGLTNLRAYPHINSTNINTTFYKEITVDGPGYYSLDVTELMQYIQTTGANASEFRITSTSTSNNILMSELVLRQEENDTIAPQISNCHSDITNATCGENITFECIITDNIDVNYAFFHIQNGGDNQYLATKDNNIYSYTIHPQYFSVETYTLTNVTAYDVFNNLAYDESNITVTYTCQDLCTPNWIVQYDDISPCTTNNTILQTKYYIDVNECDKTQGLPSDNGTIVTNYCNYCTPNWQEITGGIHECSINNTRYVEYTDDTYCYYITGLPEDAPPYNDQTWVSCAYLEQEFECVHSNDPYIKKVMDYSCTLPYTETEWQCTNQVIELNNNDLLQVNPQPKQKTTSLISIDGNIESRSSFTTTNGLLNAYFTNKNMDAKHEFMVRTICRNEEQTLINEHLITPDIRNISGRGAPYAVWLKDNMGGALIVLGLIIVLALFVGFIMKKTRRK